MPEVGPQSVTPTSGTASQSAASRADARETSTTTMTTSSDVQLPLPAPEVAVGVVVCVASKHYEITEKLGHGAEGSVHRATPRCKAAGKGRESSQGGPDSVALKLAGGGAVGFRPKDTKLAAAAVEAVAAAEVRRMSKDEAKRWEGRIFLP
eukprot:3391972-Amphidinium_carterae.1